ncbi:MAG: hypothetical protein ACTSUE_04750 [Promethearchaeota archaeon]
MEKRKITGLVLLSMLGVFAVNVTILIWRYYNGYTWVYESLDEYFDNAGFENPNMRVAMPEAVNNQIVFYPGYFSPDPAQGVSDWFIAQWQASDPITPDPSNGTGPPASDPLLGESILVARSTEVAVSIFNESQENATKSYAYELELSGGNLTAAGGRNLFLSVEPATPVPMKKEVFLNFNVNVKAMHVNGTAPENVVQFFIGIVLKCWNNGSEGHDDTLFIQGIIANSHGCRFYAAGNPSIQCGLYANLIDDDLLEPGTGTFTNLNMHVTAFLRNALPRSYPWVDEFEQDHVQNYVDQNLNHWFMTSIYLGMETQGEANGTMQVSGFTVQEGFKNYN